MILDLRDFEEFPANVELCAGPDEIQTGVDGIGRITEVTVHLAVQQGGQEFFCQGEVNAVAELECARCLGTFTEQLSGKIDFIVRSLDGFAAGEDDEDYVFLQGGELRADITDPVRQAILLELPMKPLCKEDCKGLCSTCGANLNDGACKCKNDKTDPRWDKLKDIFPKE